MKKKKKEIVNGKEKTEYDSALRTLMLVLIIFIMFYVITILVTNKHQEEEQPLLTEIQYGEILAGEAFNKAEAEYYVLFYDFTDPEAPVYSYLKEEYLRKDDALPLYVVNLNNGFNVSYLGTPSNKKVSKSGDLKINGVTLMKIKNGKNVLYQEGVEGLKDTFK